MRLPKVSRRDWLRTMSVGGVTLSAGASASWLGSLAAASEAKTAKHVIVLWMNGGPSTIDMWDLKSGAATGGSIKPIDTAVPGIQISEHLPKLAARMSDLAIVRSMTSKEGDHERASFYLRTGYAPQGAIQFPAIGALISKEIGDQEGSLPQFVSVAPTRVMRSVGGGFLGSGVSPLLVGDRAIVPADLRVADLAPQSSLGDTAQQTRLAMLADLERSSSTRLARETSGGETLSGIQAATAGALRMMKPEARRAFALEEETAATRDAYGATLFGQGCLLARRLVERGVSFVEVTLEGWDTHRDNFTQVAQLSSTVDNAFAALVADLSQRGLLESTMIVWQGEFGRTPKINDNAGRDHWPRSWSTVLAGGGIRGGQVIGKTSADGTEIDDAPIGVPDLIHTICHALKIDPRKQNASNVGRPIRIADPEAKLIAELL